MRTRRALATLLFRTIAKEKDTRDVIELGRIINDDIDSMKGSANLMRYCDAKHSSWSGSYEDEQADFPFVQVKAPIEDITELACVADKLRTYALGAVIESAAAPSR